MNNLKVDHIVYELLFCYLTLLCETEKHFYNNKICNALSIVYMFYIEVYFTYNVILVSCIYHGDLVNV